jgi:hypothetical protein
MLFHAAVCDLFFLFGEQGIELRGAEFEPFRLRAFEGLDQRTSLARRCSTSCSVASSR